MNESEVRKALEYARFYPSGDNQQFFDFTLKNDTLFIDYNAEKAEHALAYDDFTFVITLGALLQYLDVAFADQGIGIDIELDVDEFDTSKSKPGICAIKKRKGDANPVGDVLAEDLAKRVTDRRPYTAGEITDIDVTELERHLHLGYCKLVQNAQEEVYDFFALCDSLVWTSKNLGLDIMSAVKFDEDKPETGLPWRNLGLSQAETKPIKWIQSTPWLYDFFKLCGARIAMQKSQKALWQSNGAFLVFVYNQKLSRTEKCLANKQMMEVILMLSKQGYSFQPSTLSTDVLNYPLKPELNLETSKSSLDLESLTSMIEQTRDDLSLGQEEVEWIIRIGKPDSPLADEARTHRRSVDDLLSVV